MDLKKFNSLTQSIKPIDVRVELFKQGNFDFIVKGEAQNSETGVAEGEITTHHKQKQALEILTDRVHDQFLYGGAAGGAKSWTGVCWIVFSCLAYPNTNWFIARNQIKDISDSVVKTFKKVCREYGIEDFNYNSIKGYIDFPNGSHINLIEVKYKPSDPLYEDIGSTEYTGGWAEEVGEIHENAVKTLQTRIGRQHNKKYGLRKKFFLTCNPKQNWAKTNIYDKHQNGELAIENKREKTIVKTYLNCLVTENPFIEQDYIDNLRAQAHEDKAMYERLFNGNWDYEDNPYQLADQEMIDSIFENDHVPLGKNFITADVARFGSDKAVIIAWKGWVAVEILTFDFSKITDIAHAILYLRNKYKVPKLRCIADVDGVGGGVVDIGGIKGFINNAKAIRVGRGGEKTPNYRNLQVQCLYYLAEQINKGEIDIRCDLTTKVQTDIKVELAQIQSVPNERDGTKLDCKPKGKIKSDIGRSPDYRDALFMRAWFDIAKTKKSFLGSRKRENM